MVAFAHNAFSAELMATKEALSWIEENNWKDCFVSSDCLQACNDINGSANYNSR